MALSGHESIALKFKLREDITDWDGVWKTFKDTLRTRRRLPKRESGPGIGSAGPASQASTEQSHSGIASSVGTTDNGYTPHEAGNIMETLYAYG